MDVVISIAVILAAIAFTAMCAYIIVTLMTLKKVLEAMNGHVGNIVGVVRDVESKVGPLLESATGVTDKAQDLVVTVNDSVGRIGTTVNDTVERIGSSVEQGIDTVMTKVGSGADAVGNSLQKVDSMIGRITDFEARVQSKVERPVMKTFSAISGVTKAAAAFYSTLKQGRRGAANDGTTPRSDSGYNYE